MKKTILLTSVSCIILGIAVYAQTPRPEHPRPQFERAEWINLNGQWNFDFDFGQSGGCQAFMTKSGTWIPHARSMMQVVIPTLKLIFSPSTIMTRIRPPFMRGMPYWILSFRRSRISVLPARNRVSLSNMRVSLTSSTNTEEPSGCRNMQKSPNRALEGASGGMERPGPRWKTSLKN